jgi:hypothetical protein
LAFSQVALAEDIIHCEREQDDGTVTALRVYPDEAGYKYYATTAKDVILAHRHFPKVYESSGAIQRSAGEEPNQFETGTDINTAGVYRNLMIVYTDKNSDLTFTFQNEECSAVE